MSGAERAEGVETLLGLARQLGVSIADLIDADGASPNAGKTVAELLPEVEKATGAATRQTYRPYWRLLVAELGEKPLSDVRPSALQAVALEAQRIAVKRSNSRNGTSARENCVGAMRAFFRVAVSDGYIKSSPADDVLKPKRKASGRRGFTDDEVLELYEVTSTGGDDPVLDTLLLRFHLETGARRGGALALRRRDLDAIRQCVRLREKGDTERWQPVSKTLMNALADHADARGCVLPEDALFRRLPRRGEVVGLPMSRRRYNTLVSRWGRSLPWVQELGVSIHWCRHHATSAVERIGGFAVARAFAGHAEGDEVTTTYIKAHRYEVARAVAIYTGEPHPLAV